MIRARLWIVVAYVIAFAAAVFAAQHTSLEGPLWVALWADLVATLVIFGFSIAFRNSSFYDAYWSVVPLPIALYSAALFCLTEGRAYSAAEYRTWLTEADLDPGPITPTLVHCGILPGKKL